ncbi:putative ankyrin repeat protein RF_0381 [Saccostrea echinata]|uniref:putative ankyrin repeat protein RF_0381 n=1 Tax=Saccostrea echinata TaxID=191078 RepID=UPI002A82BD66|nr:putative ankyrin repeat protein RF_0381 [Saccostrea echinata]
MQPDLRSEDLTDRSTSKDTKRQIDIKTHMSVDNDKGIFVDFTVEDSELFALLKRQCENGVYIGFHYLNDTRVIKRGKHKILCQRDEIGCTLLHYAAKGSIAILEEIIRTSNEVQLDIRCFQGQTVLDYAIKYQQKDMSEFLISKHKELLLDNSTSTSQGINPFHWVAWHGDLSMFSVLTQTDIDLKTKTKNGLNLLDIAIMRNKYEFCESMIENENMLQNDKQDECGWNVAHYAAFSNNVKVLQLLKSKNDSLIMAKTKTMKTTLHIACEYGNFEAASFITEHFEDLLNCTDNLKWNALHYASKGGNTQIFHLLLEKGMDIASLTEEEKTVLHIACTSKQVKICKQVAHIFYDDPENQWLINKETTNNKWMAAHYIGVEKKGDGSEEEIVDILLNCKAKLYKRTKQGWSVLDIAVDHLNVRLVKHLLSSIHYRTKFGISKESLADNINKTKDKCISKILSNTLDEMTNQ